MPKSFDVTHGLNEAERTALRQTLSDLADQTGFAYDQVFDALSNGDGVLTALKLPPEVADLLYTQAFSRFNAGDITMAQSLFLALTLISPDRRDHWLGLGICLRCLDQSQPAQNAFSMAQRLTPEDPAVLFHLTELMCQRRDWKTAEEYLKRFIALPDTAARLRLFPEMRKLATAIEAQS